MNNMLIPIDYSDTSMNAFLYALELNQAFHAKVYLMHVFNMPLLNSSAYDDSKITQYKTHKKQHEERLKRLIVAYEQKYPYEYEVCITAGGHAIEILEFTHRQPVEMVVIGNRGMGGIKRWLFGTVAIHLLSEEYVPVMAVPHDCHFKPVKKILLVTDFTDFLNDANLDFLKAFSGRTDAVIEIAVIDNPAINEKYKKSFLRWLDIEFKKQPEVITMQDANAIIERVNAIASVIGADIVAAIPHPHNWMEILFLGTCIEKIPVLVNLPIMTLPLNRDSFNVA